MSERLECSSPYGMPGKDLGEVGEPIYAEPRVLIRRPYETPDQPTTEPQDEPETGSDNENGGSKVGLSLEHKQPDSSDKVKVAN